MVKGKIVRLSEGLEMVVIFEPQEFDDPDRCPFGTDRVICNPSSLESVSPVLKGVAYGWLMAPGARKVPLIIDNFHLVPAATENLGFSKRQDSASGFTITTTQELTDLLAERYAGTLNAQLVNNAANDNYIGQFYSAIVSKLLSKNYTVGSSITDYSALMLYADDVKTGFTLYDAVHSAEIDANSKPTVSAVIQGLDTPTNIYVTPKLVNAVRKYLFTEVDNSFSNRRKNCILRATRCFCPSPITFDKLEGVEVDSDGFLKE
jgi:hypothetical protein